MSREYRLAAPPGAALILALCASCDGAPKELAFDRQAPGGANQVPALESTPGTLRYRPGCLFLDAGGGDEIGLVVPAEAAFDGRRLYGKLTTPEGEPVVREVGRFVSFSGRVINNPGDGRYGCDTRKMLITDYF
ncbi:MAG TPA: hypothetical protein VD846_09350 [Allosphingosinicella sp.]|nr:hypothetical protein [Allosphingosinicella sp.]